jgi:hypothetical protein
VIIQVPITDLEKLIELKEKDFTTDRVMPLLSGLGYRGVTYVGGANPPERGRDVVFYEIDEKLLTRRDMGAQVKAGDIDAGVAGKLLDQINEAFNFTHQDPESGEPRRICHLFVIASGKILPSVIDRVRVERPLFFPFITFWDGEQILQQERTIASSSTRVSMAEKQIHVLGLAKLFEDIEFIGNVNVFLRKMFEESKLSELRLLGELPGFLLGVTCVKQKIEVLPVADQREVLFCLSIMIINKANRNYGAESTYGIGDLKRTRA